MEQESGAQIAVSVRIEGRVQGVWYRAWTRETALRLGLRGWVRNDSDGAVSARFEGASQAVETMLALCETGPRDARVSRVLREIEPLDPGDLSPDFRITH